MSATFVMDYWWLWVVGMVVSPLLMLLPQLGLIRKAIELGESDPVATGKLFVQPMPMTLFIVFGMATFAFAMLFGGAVVVMVASAIRQIWM